MGDQLVLEDRADEESRSRVGCTGQVSGRSESASDGDRLKRTTSGRSGSRSPSRQKVFKSKPRGFDEEVVTSFSRIVHLDIQMEDSIWAFLPEDLLNEILARVPPFVLFKLRSVCKRWNSIISDVGFIKFHGRLPSHGPCLLAFWKNLQTPQCSVFSLPLKTWYKLPFSFLPEWAFLLVGSSGGLACFSGLDGLCFKTVVCNPLTQTWRTLPTMHHNQQRHLILVVDREDRSFKVIATSDIYGERTLPTEVYDSKSNTWSLHQVMPAVNLCSSKIAFCDSRIYLETLSPPGLMMYRLDTGCWEHIPVKFPKSLLDGYLVAGTYKRLFLVGRIGMYSTHQSMKIWELDHGKTVWVEIGRMPHRLFKSLLRLSAERFECFGQDNLICFTSWNQGKGLLYDIERKAWSWIAGCVLQSWSSQVTFYEPRYVSTRQSMKIWELDHGKTVWVEIGRMPHRLFKFSLRLSAERFECFGQDNLICFTSWNQGKGLLYDIERKAWSWIAGCVFQSWSSQVTFYEPRTRKI